MGQTRALPHHKVPKPPKSEIRNLRNKFILNLVVLWWMHLTNMQCTHTANENKNIPNVKWSFLIIMFFTILV